MLRSRLAALATISVLTLTSTAAMAWETYVPPFGGQGRPYVWTTARIRDFAILNVDGSNPWVSFDQSIADGCAALRRVEPGLNAASVTLGQTDFHVNLPGPTPSFSNTMLSILLWAKAQNMPVRVRLAASPQGSLCSLASIETCSDPATCADPPTNP